MNSFTTRPILYTGTLFIALAACSAGESDGRIGPVCSSTVYWKDMDKGSEAMHPGAGCNSCHEKNLSAPLYPVSGTVYPTLHEPDDCNGVASSVDDNGIPDVQIVVTDRTGRALPPIPVNSVGNFLRAGELLTPIWVKVVSKGKENKMEGQAPHADCNACHTKMGTQGAPGRVIIPQ